MPRPVTPANHIPQDRLRRYLDKQSKDMPRIGIAVNLFEGDPIATGGQLLFIDEDGANFTDENGDLFVDED
jgi:hypothetical protein